MSDLSAEAQAIIDAARGADDPTPGDQQRVRAAVFAELGIPGGGAGNGATAGGASATGLTGSLALKLVLAIVIAGGLVAGGLTLFSGADPAAPVATAPSVSPSPEPAHLPSEDLLSPPAGRAETASQQPSRVPGEDLASPPEERAATASKQPLERSPARTGARSPRTTLETLRAEKALIDEARRALAASDATAALAALERHARQFPRGQLVSERLGTRVLALCAQGRAADAARDAKRFLARYPEHPMAARVRAACAD